MTALYKCMRRQLRQQEIQKELKKNALKKQALKKNALKKNALKKKALKKAKPICCNLSVYGSESDGSEAKAQRSEALPYFQALHVFQEEMNQVAECIDRLRVWNGESNRQPLAKKESIIKVKELFRKHNLSSADYYNVSWWVASCFNYTETKYMHCDGVWSPRDPDSDRRRLRERSADYKRSLKVLMEKMRASFKSEESK